MVLDSVNAAEKMGSVKTGDLVVVAAGVPLGIQGNTNMIKVHTVGNAVLSGIGIGKAPVTGFAKLTTSDNLDDFVEGDILVCKSLTPDLFSVLEKAAAIVTEEGGEQCEAAHAAAQYNIPVVMDVLKAREVLGHGKIISVDPEHGMVYQGRVRLK